MYCMFNFFYFILQYYLCIDVIYRSEPMHRRTAGTLTLHVFGYINFEYIIHVAVPGRKRTLFRF